MCGSCSQISEVTYSQPKLVFKLNIIWTAAVWALCVNCVKSAAPRTNSRLFFNIQLPEVLASLLATADFFVVRAWIDAGGFYIAQNPPVSSNQGPARKPRLSKASRRSTTQGLASPASRDSSPRLPPLPSRLFGGAALQLALADWLLLARSPGWRERGSLLEADWVRLRTC